MNSRRISFSEARGKLTSIVDQVERTGEPVTILRRGRPAAVVISHESYEERFGKPKGRWKLAGSIRVKAGVDVDAAIRKGREGFSRALGKRAKQL
jgi:prevent-host-death family protein